MSIPFQKPSPPQWRECVDLFTEIDASGSYSNFGPMVQRLETEMIERIFDKNGSITTVNNATIGLILAIKEATASHKLSARRYALMPSFTFAATAHAAIWAGFTPLFCDVDPETWLPSATHEDILLDIYGDDIAVIVPYATFGNALNLERYLAIRESTGIPVVVDAAPCLGSLDSTGKQFGTGQPLPIVYSLHATKIFATGEGGLIYSNDEKITSKLRIMSNFGFTEPRITTLPGLNAKMSEYSAAQAIAQLARFPKIVERRNKLVERYLQYLPTPLIQKFTASPPAYQFMPVLCAEDHAGLNRDAILDKMSSQGIHLGKYFYPALHMHPYFAQFRLALPLSATESLSRRIMSLPLFDNMKFAQVDLVVETLLPLLGYEN